MGIVQTKLGDYYKKQWMIEHPKYVSVISKQISTANDMREMVDWVKNNTDGYSTAEFCKGKECHLRWFFNYKKDAVLFKLTWS